MCAIDFFVSSSPMEMVGDYFRFFLAFCKRWRDSQLKQFLFFFFLFSSFFFLLFLFIFFPPLILIPILTPFRLMLLI